MCKEGSTNPGFFGHKDGSYNSEQNFPLQKRCKDSPPTPMLNISKNIMKKIWANKTVPRTYVETYKVLHTIVFNTCFMPTA